MTFEMMKYFSEYTHTIVMSGDGDYYWVLEYLLLSKKSVTLIAHTTSTARELKTLFGQHFTGLHTLKHIIAFKHKK